MSLLQNSNAISAGGYDLTNSLRFRSSATAYLNRTPLVNGNGQTWTLSMWVKRGALGAAYQIFGVRPLGTSSPRTMINFEASDQLIVYTETNSITTTQVFRDPSAWYHIVVAFNTTNATAANRVKIYVNGSEITTFASATYPAQNFTSSVNQTVLHLVGAGTTGAGAYTQFFDGYMDEVNLIGGQALTPSSFGETDAVTGSWVAKKYTGTYGTNGFYLPFTHTEANENRFLYSEDFANASWTKGGSTLTSNTVVAPDGTTTADTLTDNATTDQHLILQAISTQLVGSQYTMSIYAKANTRSQIGLTMHGESAASFDLTAGTVLSSGGFSNVGIQSVGNGWYRCYVTITKTNATSNIYYIIYKDGVNPYLGTGTGSIYIWGAQITYGPTLQSYIKTTTAAITNQGTAENKVLNSEDATNATWTKVAVTTTANTTTAPNGTTTADSLLETTANSLHVLLPATSLSLAAATIHTASLYVKPINNQFIQLVLDDTATTNGGAANYDLINGTVTSSTNYGIGFGINASITSVGSGWYRISLSTSIGSGTTARFAINAIQSGSSGLFPNYVGNASNGYYVWGMQVEESSTLGPYMPTTSSAQSKVLRIGADKSLGATGFGYDSWIPNNISLTPGTTYDAMIDVPTNTSATVANYAVLNPLDNSAGTITQGNLQVATGTTQNTDNTRGTIAVSSGKWYWEGTFVTFTTQANAMFGVSDATVSVTNSTWVTANGWFYYANNGNKYTNSAGAAYGNSFTTNDIIGVALDMDNGKIFFSKNGVWQNSGDPAAGTNAAYTTLSGKTLTASLGEANGFSQTFAFNFGQRPFSYTPPTGYKALNTYNLPNSTILKGNRYMDATLWTGTATGAGANTITITNAAGFKPDFVWAKGRSIGYAHGLFNSVVGAEKFLASNSTNAELVNEVDGYLTSFNSNGFTLSNGSNSNLTFNTSPATYVAWQWQAGQGTNTTNTAGSITSTVSANPTAGFSIVTYTGTGAAATVGHGLGVAPKMVITKKRSAAGDEWVIWHTSLTSGTFILLFTISAQFSSTQYTAVPSPTVLNLNTATAVNNNGSTYVSYCWAEIDGFSKFGSYTGNGSTNGPFVYTGFRPKFIMYKRTDSTSNWQIEDTSRATYNAANAELFTNLNIVEYTTAGVEMDILSNGFKLRNTNADRNANGGTYIYMAFAENPFKNSNAR